MRPIRRRTPWWPWEGYGRREMSPCSDVDLLFLFDREKDKSAGLISGVLHPLWDVGFDIGHGSRTITESVRMTRDDMESCTAMLDGRFLAGDRELFDKFRKRLFARPAEEDGEQAGGAAALPRGRAPAGCRCSSRTSRRAPAACARSTCSSGP